MDAPRWVVTGGSGFLGRHLLDRLAGSKGGPSHAAVVAVGRRQPVGWGGEFLEADSTDLPRVRAVVAEVRPSAVCHLAGRTPPGSPEEFEAANVQGTQNWLSALAEAGRGVRFVLAGSAAELGPVPVTDLPVDEDYPARPVDPYGASKLRATLASLAAPEPIEAIVARVFNPVGPGLAMNQALGRFARAIAAGSGPLTLTVGDLRPRRDFVDVRDVADALIALAVGRGRAGRVYHIGTGRSHSVAEGLERLIALSGRAVTVEVDPERARSAGPLDSRAAIERITQETGWTPQIPWEQSLTDLWSSVANVGEIF